MTDTSVVVISVLITLGTVLVFGIIFLTSVLTAFALQSHRDWTDTEAAAMAWVFVFAISAVGLAGVAVWSLIQGSGPAAFIAAGGCGYSAYTAWDIYRKRGKRKRKPARAIGVVRDLGGRLGIVPAP